MEENLLVEFVKNTALSNPFAFALLAFFIAVYLTRQAEKEGEMVKNMKLAISIALFVFGCILLVEALVAVGNQIPDGHHHHEQDQAAEAAPSQPHKPSSSP